MSRKDGGDHILYTLQGVPWAQQTQRAQIIMSLSPVHPSTLLLCHSPSSNKSHPLIFNHPILPVWKMSSVSFSPTPNTNPLPKHIIFTS